jgi:hypothetical protein
MGHSEARFEPNSVQHGASPWGSSSHYPGPPDVHNHQANQPQNWVLGNSRFPGFKQCWGGGGVYNSGAHGAGNIYTTTSPAMFESRKLLVTKTPILGLVGLVVVSILGPFQQVWRPVDQTLCESRECIPIYWGTPLYGNSSLYLGVPQHVGMHSHILIQRPLQP